MIMKMFRGLGIGAGIMSVAYLAMLCFFHLGSPNPNFDYLGDLNRELVELAPEQKAWNIYRSAWTKYGFSEGGGCTLHKDVFIKDGNQSRLAGPLDEDWSKAVAALEEHSELLDTFRLGAKLPTLGLELKANPRDYSPEDFAALFPNRDQGACDFSWGFENPNPETEALMKDSLIGVLLPHVQSFCGAARAFHADTRLAVVQGDSDRAVENIETVLGLARQTSDAQLLVCSLVGYAVASIGFNQLEEAIAADPDFFSEEQLARLQVAVENADVRSWIGFEGERAFIKDIIQRTYTDNGNGDGRMTATGLDVLQYCQMVSSQKNELNSSYFAVRNIVGPISLVMCADRKEITETLDELMDQSIADSQLPRWLSEGTDVESILDNNKFRYLALGFIFPATDQVRNAMDRTLGRQEGVITALAIHRYYKKYGEWPMEYDQISPEFVTEFPVDIIDGSLAKFKYDDDSLMIYSVGNDLDDDGGMDRESDSQGTNNRDAFLFRDVERAHDGDWILWPQQVPSFQ